MPDNGNLTDKLSIEISASVNPAIKAIDSLQTKLNLLSGSLQHFTDAGKYKSALDNMASGFERLNQVASGIDTSRIEAFSKSLSKVSGSITGFTKAAEKIEQAFTPVKKEPETVADVVRKELEPELKALGITGEDSIGKVVNSFVHLGDAINGKSDDFNGALEGTIKLLQENASVAVEATRAYDGLLEAVESSLKAMQKAGSKVYINSTDKDGYRDGRYNYLLGEMSTIGKGFGGSKRFTTTDNTQQDFQEWAGEIQKETGLLGQAMVEAPGGMGFEYDFGKFVEILKKARAEADQLAQGGDRVKISFDDACGVIDSYADKIANTMKNFTQSEVTEESVSPMQRLLGTIKELEGVTIPDFSGLNSLTTLAGKIGNEKGAAIGENLARIVESLRGISGDVTIPDFSSLQALGEGMQKLGLKSATQGAQNIPIIAKALTELSFAQIPSDFTSLAGLAESIRALGLSSAQKAAQNIPQLAQALNDLITSLAEMPEVSDKTLRLVEALGQLDGANMKVANSTNHVAKNHNVASQAIQRFTSHVATSFKNTNVLASAYGKVSEGVSGFVRSMDNAKSHTQSFTMMVIKARTMLWMFRRVFNLFSQPLELASSLVEVQNVIDNVFTENYAAKIEDMSKSVKDSLGMSELSFKQYASRYQAMGKAMGITNSQMTSAQDSLKGMGVAYGEANGNMQDMSVNLTRLAADLASFYDIDQKTAFEKLQAVYTGQTRPLRALGIDLTQATLQEWALKHGIDADIQSMTQAEKTMLRYQYVLAQTTSAHGDYARTIRSWHNQIILLKENFKELGIIIGSGLIQAIKPFVMAMNAAFKAVLTFSTNVLNALGQIFGWEVETFARGSSLEDFADTLDDVSGGIGDAASGADDTASGLDKADKAAKKLKATVLGFDELNILNGADEDLNTAVDSGSGTGSGSSGLGSGVGGLGGDGFGDIEYKLKKTDSKFKSAIDNLYDLGKYISDSLAKSLDKINWNKIYKKAENFGKGLAEFLNGLVQPHTFESLGRTVGNSINTAMRALDSFAYTFDFHNLGSSIALGVRTALESINWTWVRNAAVSWGYGLGAYLNGLIDEDMFASIGDSIAHALNAVIVGAIAFTDVFEGSKVGTAIATGINHAIEGINWENALTAAKGIGDDVSSAINNFIQKTHWDSVGSTLANALNTGLTTFFSITDNLDWEGIGTAIGTAINSFLEDFDAEDFTNGVNGIIDGLLTAIDALKETGAWDNCVKKIGEVLGGLDWVGLTKLYLADAKLNFVTSIATDIANGLAGNPVKAILSGGVSLMGNALSTALALKIAGVGGGGAAAGSVAGAAGAAGAAISGSLAAGLIAGGAAVAAAALVIAGIVSAATYEWKDKSVEGMATLGEEIAVRLGLISENWLRENKRVTDGEELMYRDLLEKAKQNGYDRATYWDEANKKFYQITEDSTGKIEKKEVEFWDATKNAFSDGKDGANESVNGLWENTESVFSKGEQDAIDHINNLWNESKSKTDEGTQDTLATIKDFADNHEAELSGLKEKIIGTTEEAWSNAGRTTSDYTAQMQTDVETANAEIKRSYGSLGREIGYSVNGDYGRAMDDMQSIGERAAEGIKNAFQSVTDFFNGLDFPTWHLEWEQHEEGGYGFSLPKIVRYASGGFPDAGLFFANEYGNPEMIGTIGRRPAVANNDQITTAIRGAVVDGMMQVFMATGGMGGNGGSPTVEVTVKADSETLYRTVRRGEQKYNRRYSVVAQM